MKICIVGAGSLGRRHIENLRKNPEIEYLIIVEPDRQRWKQSIQEQDSTLGYRNQVGFHESIGTIDRDWPDGVIICTPTHLHSECALPFLEQGIPVLIEKPLSHDLKSAILLAPYHRLIRVGYTMRFHPAMEFISQHLEEIGKPYYIQAEVGQYLPDWHPAEDYRNWYMAHKDRGGGAALDLSHEIDTVQWLMNSIISDATGFSVHISDLEISSDDLTMIQGRFLNGVCFQINQNLLDRTYNRRLKIVGSEKTISWDSHRDWTVHIGDVQHCISNTDHRNMQFLLEEREFMRWIQDRTLETDLCEYDRAFHTLEVAIGIRDHRRFSFNNPNVGVNLKRLSWSPRDE